MISGGQAIDCQYSDKEIKRQCDIDAEKMLELAGGGFMVKIIVEK